MAYEIRSFLMVFFKQPQYYFILPSIILQHPLHLPCLFHSSLFYFFFPHNTYILFALLLSNSFLYFQGVPSHTFGFYSYDQLHTHTKDVELGSTHNKEYVVFFLGFGYLTQYNIFQLHPFIFKLHSCIFISRGIEFHCVQTLCINSSLIS